jgi:hypothetical protein
VEYNELKHMDLAHIKLEQQQVLCHLLSPGTLCMMSDARYYKVAVYCTMLSSQLRELLDTLKAECKLTLRAFLCEKKQLPLVLKHSANLGSTTGTGAST